MARRTRGQPGVRLLSSIEPLPRALSEDVYHRLITMPWPRLVALLLGSFLVGNAVFAMLYLAVGPAIEHARPGSFADAFFFSVQTMATIGYGTMSPRGLTGNALVTGEAAFGLFGLAIVTGIVFAKFARPTARVLFSRVAVVAPRDGVPSLMFRMANERGTNIVEATVHVSLVRWETTVEGERLRRFYDLPLVRGRTILFALTWTAVHPIDRQSALHGADAASLERDGAEIFIALVGHDETFVQTVHARHHYDAREIVWNARFADVLTSAGDGDVVYDPTRFHDVVRIADAT